ncbi:metalloprotease [Arenibacter palladensis]|uniref:metalloprotease n=1 Tax=Arenibacter palladensis TaxID=237373 RepID=UPI002FD236C2
MKKLEYIRKPILLLIFLCINGLSIAQHSNKLTATLDVESKTFNIQQEIIYENNSKDTLEFIYFNDWANAYANKNTALAKRFSEEFKKGLHLAREEERGNTKITSTVDDNYQGLDWEYAPGRDIIKISLNHPLPPKESTKIFITYKVKLPSDKFTTYGYDNRGGYYLKDWYLTPAVYDGEWHLYSNKNLEDLYTDMANTSIELIIPQNLFAVSNFHELGKNQAGDGQHIYFQGINQKSGEIIIRPSKQFVKHVTPEITIFTDLQSTKYDEISSGISINRVSKYIYENLGDYPHKQLLVSELDYNKDPLYGINQLPSFIRPYEEQFQFEMKFLKTALNSFIRETMFLDPRNEKWVTDAILNYLMIGFVEEYYPDQKLLGKLSSIWGVRNFHLAKMNFNEQYPLLHMLSARRNIDQSLTTPNDSLVKFNQKIANRYKAGLGLAYLADYTGKEHVDRSVKEFYINYRLKPTTAADFKFIVVENSDKDINWFFDEYVSTTQKIDFKIKKVRKMEDSLVVILKNKEGTNVPISLFGIKNDTVVSNYWFTDITDQQAFRIPKNGEDRLVLNYDQTIPEFNQRDNWKSLNGFFSSNKKLKFQFFKDAEDPYYNQIFYVPVLGFNKYDGLSPGMRLHNKTLLERPFVFDLAPTYAPNEKTFVGYGKFNFRKYHGKSGLYVTNYSLRGSTSHFQENSRYSTVSPSIGFGWRPSNLLLNKREALIFRSISVFRDIDPNLQSLGLETDPDYNVFNAKYYNTHNNIINYLSWSVDAQYSDKFTKLAYELEYRKLFENNRQFNLRFFAGKFLRNETAGSTDFFSFSLDRPTDYLFDYEYLGRSEGSGIYSQQIIVAEGGFKSKLENPFANDWMATVNTSVNIWRWIEVYGDLGFVKNKGLKERFVYDSGIRLNLLTDYFELYFPLYSNNGWEISQPQYDQKIRFVITFSPRTLTGLFTRKWF